jgi:hypothetical protein
MHQSSNPTVLRLKPFPAAYDIMAVFDVRPSGINHPHCHQGANVTWTLAAILRVGLDRSPLRLP